MRSWHQHGRDMPCAVWRPGAGSRERWSTWESPGTGDQGEVSGGVWRTEAGAAGPRQAAVGSWSDDRARGVGGREGAEVSPAGGRGGRGRRGGTASHGLLPAPGPRPPGGRFLGPALLSASPLHPGPVNKVSPPSCRTFLKQNLLSLPQPSLSLTLSLPSSPSFLSLISSPSCPLLPGNGLCTSSEIILAITRVLS